MSTVLSVVPVLSLVVLATLPQTPASPAAPKTQVTVTAATDVLTLDLKSKGQRVRQLSWSPDLTQLCLQTYDANKDASVKALYYYLLPVNGGKPTRVETPPEWAAEYWAWKSGQSAPGDPTWKIEVSSEKKIANATSMPMGGDLARGGTVDPASTGIAVESVTAMAAGTTNVNVYTMRLGSVTVGEWINHPIMPGVTFGWGPTGSGLIAFAETGSGRLILMDRTGAKKQAEGTKNVMLPAFTPDLTRLAYLENRSRDVYTLVIATLR
jgi:hypothetical protein